mmetsp:Transcript_91372/g.136809  ORF Transcript_91372/g.136809 Transcript_91372/m.136809 type:complete len:177 (+) Transcript_91372:81-611(+)
MGNACCCCKCEPRWKNDQDVICAYVYEECACCRPRRFLLRGVRDDDAEHPWNAASNSKARELIENDVFDPHGVPIHIVEEVPKACCGYEMFEAAVSRLNVEWVPKMNRSLETYGLEVDGFEWVEYRYVSHGQYGGHTQPVPHFCIRVKKLPVVCDETERGSMMMGAGGAGDFEKDV